MEEWLLQRKKIWWQNFNRLQVWCNVGNDVENGIWAMYGARLGCKMAVLEKWNTNQIADYDWFKTFFYDEVAPAFSGETKCQYSGLEWDPALLETHTKGLGIELNGEIHGMVMTEPDAIVSEFFKLTYVNPKRWGVMVREKQIQDILEKGLM